MKNITISKGGVTKQLKILDPYKAAGPDNISPRVLRENAEVLASPLATHFQLSLDKAEVPSDWKRPSSAQCSRRETDINHSTADPSALHV